ncbi:MAG TPA: hypothetical protein VGK67_23745 [Myxococcales bacterium]|jgi:hypothetical protein
MRLQNVSAKTIARAPRSLLAMALLGVLFASSSAQAARQLTASLSDFVTEMRIFMPGEGSNGYVVPTSEERSSFSAAAVALASGNLERAEQALASYPGFELLDFRDGPEGATYWAIAEKPPFVRGWGFYFFAREPSRGTLVVEAPHPLADRDSELLAAKMVSTLRPAAFLLAGAHRYADAGRTSDMTHAAYSIFESVHEAVLSAPRVALQIHGFNSATHVGYPELLLSSGTTKPGPDSEQICTAVTSKGVGCTLFTGVAYTDLGAQTNVQGSNTRQVAGDGHFFHFETGDAVRDEQAKGDAVVQAIGEHWPSPEAGHGCGCGAASCVPPGSALWVLGALAWRRRSTLQRLGESPP